MRFFVFYRSNKNSSSIASSAKMRLEKENISGLTVDFVNLDKRNYKKLLNNTDPLNPLPRCIFVWNSEEEVVDYLHQNYPDIEIIPFNYKNSVRKDNSGMYPTKEYLLADLIVQKYKERLDKKLYYVVRNNEIFEQKLDPIDLAKSRCPAFKEREKAETYCLQEMEKQCDNLRNLIDDYTESIKEYKYQLKQMEKKMESFVNNLDNEREENDFGER